MKLTEVLLTKKDIVNSIILSRKVFGKPSTDTPNLIDLGGGWALIWNLKEYETYFKFVCQISRFKNSSRYRVDYLRLRDNIIDELEDLIDKNETKNPVPVDFEGRQRWVIGMLNKSLKIFHNQLTGSTKSVIEANVILKNIH